MNLETETQPLDDLLLYKDRLKWVHEWVTERRRSSILSLTHPGSALSWGWVEDDILNLIDNVERRIVAGPQVDE